LEPALRLGDALGGHLVSGHVDGVAELLERSRMSAPSADDFACRDPGRYIARKGSVTLDGVSLTVTMCLVTAWGQSDSHTLMHTTLGTTR